MKASKWVSRLERLIEQYGDRELIDIRSGIKPRVNPSEDYMESIYGTQPLKDVFYIDYI